MMNHDEKEVSEDMARTLKAVSSMRRVSIEHRPQKIHHDLYAAARGQGNPTFGKGSLASAGSKKGWT